MKCCGNTGENYQIQPGEWSGMESRRLYGNIVTAKILAAYEFAYRKLERALKKVLYGDCITYKSQHLSLKIVS